MNEIRKKKRPRVHGCVAYGVAVDGLHLWAQFSANKPRSPRGASAPEETLELLHTYPVNGHATSYAYARTLYETWSHFYREHHPITPCLVIIVLCMYARIRVHLRQQASFALLGPHYARGAASLIALGGGKRRQGTTLNFFFCPALTLVLAPSKLSPATLALSFTVQLSGKPPTRTRWCRKVS